MPWRQASFPDIERLNGVQGVFVRPVVRHMERPRTNNAGKDDPDGDSGDIIFLEAFACGFTCCQPDGDCHGSKENDGIPAQDKMAHVEDDGVKGDCEHLFWQPHGWKYFR